MQIVGADGQFMTEDEGQLMIIASGIESGAIASPDVYNVGAALATRLSAARPASPAVARFRGLALNPNVMARLRHFAPAPVAPIQTIPTAPQPTVQSVTPGELREVVQGLDSGPTLVPAGGSVTIQFNASMLFRPTRLMVGPSVAPLFTIDDIKVSADSLFLSTGSVPAESFLPDSVNASALKRRTAQPGTPVQILITNIDGAPHRFRGAIYGDAADASSCGPNVMVIRN